MPAIIDTHADKEDKYGYTFTNIWQLIRMTAINITMG